MAGGVFWPGGDTAKTDEDSPFSWCGLGSAASRGLYRVMQRFVFMRSSLSAVLKGSMWASDRPGEPDQLAAYGGDDLVVRFATGRHLASSGMQPMLGLPRDRLTIVGPRQA